MRPSRLQLPALLAMIQAAGGRASYAGAGARADGQDGRASTRACGSEMAEMRGLSAETPQGPFKLAAMQVQPGRRQDRRICDRRARRPHAARARQTRTLRAQIASTSPASCGWRRSSRPRRNSPRPNRALGLIPLIGGVETQGRRGPLQGHRQARQHRYLQPGLGPVHRSDPEQGAPDREDDDPARRATMPDMQALVAAGLDTAGRWTSISARHGRRRHAASCWTPASLELGGAAQGFSARVRSPTCRGGCFRPIRRRRSAAAAQIEAGTLELTLRDTRRHRPRGRATCPRAERQPRGRRGSAIVDGIRSGREQAAGANPDAVAAVEALARFVETPGQTLVVKLTPTRQGAGVAARSAVEDRPAAWRWRNSGSRLRRGCDSPTLLSGRLSRMCKLAKLLRGRCRRGVHQQIVGLLVHREHGHLCAGSWRRPEEDDDTVDAGRHATMRRRAIRNAR